METPSPKRYSSMTVSSPETWRDALEQHCRQHACLQATLLQLTKVRNNGDAQVSWELPRSSDVIKPNEYENFKVGGAQTNSAAAEANSSLTTSTPRKVYNAAKTIIGGIYSTVKQYSKDEDEYWQDMEPEQETRQSFTPVALDQPLVHVELTRQCLSTILEEVFKKTSQESSSSLMYRRSPWVFLARSDWTVWARNCTSSVFPAPNSLALHDTDWLLEVLIANHNCRVLSRQDVHKSDIVIFQLDVKTINTIVTEKDAALQVPLALFDLRYSMKEIEQRLEQWTHQVQICSQKALEYKRKSQGKLALAQMARRKLLQEQIDAQSSTLLQLERVYNSIDTTQSNQNLLSLLSEGTQLLKQLSNETPVEEIDHLQADLQDVLEQVEETSVALASFHQNAVSDDDLLAELASLTISDNHSEVESEPEALAERNGLAQVSSKDSSQDGAPDQDNRKAQQLEPMAC